MRRPHIHKLYWLLFTGTALVVVGLAWLVWAALPPGGFLEDDSVTPARQRMDAGDLAAFVPATKGAFTFPAPYNTRGVRITDATDCTAGSDCIWYVGYPYWMNMNAHTHSETMLIFLGTRNATGPALFAYNKRTEVVTARGPLMPTGTWRLYSGEGWYWSADPDKASTLYVYAQLHDGAVLHRYNVDTQAFETVVDITRQFGANRVLDQVHSSLDDTVHSMTIRDSTIGGTSKNAWPALGCAVYNERSLSWKWYPKVGTFDECSIDQSGLWTFAVETIAGSVDNRVFDNLTGVETRITGACGTLGHFAMGNGYVVGVDNNCPGETQPNAIRLWSFNPLVVEGPVIFYSYDWNVNQLLHMTHTNARPSLPSAWQVVCGSNATLTYTVADEIQCIRIDTSYQHLVVAPVMTDPAASGGGAVDYNKRPKGNLDITGQYFIWTTNLGSSRLDAFLVKVPTQRLQPSVEATPHAPRSPRAQ